MADWTVPGQLVGHHQHKAVSIGIPQILIQRACLYPRQLQCLAGDPDGLPVVRQGRSQIVLAVDQILPSFQSHCGPPLHGPEGGIVAECHQHVPAGKLVVAGVVRQIVGDLGVLPLIDRVPPHRCHWNRAADLVLIGIQMSLVFRADVQIKGGCLFHPALKHGAEGHSAPLHDQGGGEQQGDRGHDDPHGGQLGGESAEDQQSLPSVLFRRTPFKKGGDP